MHSQAHHPLLLLGAALATFAAPAIARDSIGVFESWGAFRDSGPQRCFALSEPVRRDSGAFASISSWPDSGVRNQFHARLSRPLARAARPSVSIGDRRFALIGRGNAVWAADARADAALVAAMRSARSMSVEGVDRGGRPFADTYALRGAATAIDAATLGCARR